MAARPGIAVCSSSRFRLKTPSLAEKAPLHTGRSRAASKLDHLASLLRNAAEDSSLLSVSGLGASSPGSQKEKGSQHLEKKLQLPPVHGRKFPGLQPKFFLSAFQRYSTQDAIREKAKMVLPYWIWSSCQRRLEGYSS